MNSLKGLNFGIFAIFLLSFLVITAEAEVLNYDRGEVVRYAERYCNEINSEKYKEYPSDCANFVSQALIEGFGGNPFHCVKGGATIGKDGTTKGITFAKDIGSILSSSFCFKTVSLSEAKAGDIVVWGDKHSGIIDGNKNIAAHSSPYCFSDGEKPSYFVNCCGTPTIYQFQDSDKCKKCDRDEKTCKAEMKDKCTKADTCNADTGACEPKCKNVAGGRCQPRVNYDFQIAQCITSQGGECPDDTLTVGTGIVPQPAPEIISSATIGILETGFTYDVVNLLQAFKEEARVVQPGDMYPTIIKDMPLLVIPSAGLYGMEKSEFFKVTLDEYVKEGGTILVLSQQHGYQYSVIPGGLRGYGWLEDQSCQINSSYIDTWHAALAGQTKSTPSLNVDGYFTVYPENTSILLRRTSNGQPAVLLYPYGSGYVIATSAYTDTAYTRGEASEDERKLIRDIVAWAKSASSLVEIRPGEVANVVLRIINNDTAETATAAEIEIYDPDRKEVKLRTKVPVNLAPGQNAQIPLTYPTSPTDPLGIYKIKYSLLTEGFQLLTSEENPEGVNVWLEYLLQPPMEEASGRFVVSNPPLNPYKPQDLLYSINTPTEYFLIGQGVPFTVTIWNNSNADKRLKLYWDLSHSPASSLDEVTVAAHGTLSRNYTVYPPYYGTLVRLWVHFFEENGTAVTKQTWVNVYGESWPYVGSCSKGITVISPSANVTVNTNKAFYGKGEMVSINTSLKNDTAVSWQTNARITITDPKNTVVFEDAKAVVLSPNGNGSVISNFALPLTSLIGTYNVRSEALYENGLVLAASTKFELPQSQITGIPNLSQPFTSGSNIIPFTITNTGSISVSSGVLDVTMKDPDGNVIFSDSHPFAMAVGESKTLDIPISIPSLKLGNYTLTYSQSDETRTGKPTSIMIPNSLEITNLTFDRISYKIREAANLIVDLKNTGKFNVENVSVTVSAPDASYIDTKTISMGVNPNTASLNLTIPIPETITSGQHNVNVTVALSSGTNLTRSGFIVIPESILTIEYPGASTIPAGDTINMTIENTGGVDSTYASEEVFIIDSKGVVIYQGNIAGTVLAGEKTSLTSIQIPSQTVDGTVFLNVRIKDSYSDRKVSYYKPLKITGLTATLQTMTDKDVYLKTEPITDTTRVTNGLIGIEGGELKVVLNKLKGIGTGQFSHFLPKYGWWAFSYPRAVAVSADGSVYVVDQGKNHIVKFDSSGNFITKWGTFCEIDSDWDGVPEQPCEGQFAWPSGIAIGPDGSVYVVDGGNNRIQEFDSSGNFITKWGSVGSGDGQFYYPYDVAPSLDGSLYVADTENNRIQKFDSSGNFITKWGGLGSGDGFFNYPLGLSAGLDSSVYVVDTLNLRIQKFSGSGNFFKKWGVVGRGDGEFVYPEDIAVDQDGSIYVVDMETHRIQKFNSSGSFIMKWGSFCEVDTNWDGIPDQPCDGQFNYPEGIAIGPDGSVYVADTWNHRIQKFYGDGNLITKWGSYCATDTNEDGLPDQPCSGQFAYPYGIAVGPDGSVYVSDTENNRIQKFDSSGSLTAEWQFILEEWRFNHPSGIAAGSDGSIYVVDTGNRRIQKFDSNGNFITNWEIDVGEGEEGYPQFGIAVSPDGSVYLSNRMNDRIQRFDSSGNFITEWGGFGDEDGQFYYPGGIAVGSDGSVYVADSYNHRIQRMITGNITETLFETTLPINQLANTTIDYTTQIGTLNATGKLNLQATLKNSLGQTIAQANYPFYIIEGNTVLLFNTDKKVYTPGETVTITGQIENRAPIGAENLTFTLHSILDPQNPGLVYTETFNLPAGGTHPFTITTTAGAEGTVSLTGKVAQNNSTLVEIADQYEVGLPNVSVTVSVPDVIGNEPFNINVEMRNEGKADATVQFGVQSSEFGDSQTIMIPPGETKLIQYQQQIHQATTYTFTFLGDLINTITKSVSYGLGATIQFGVGSSELGVFPEGNVAVPVTITNTGQLAETLALDFQVSPGTGQYSKVYYLPAAGSTTDTLYFNLTEGDYQITANSELPTASAQAHFSVRKENKVEITVSLGTQTNGLIPVTVNINNIGYNEISGTINVSVSPSTGSGQIVWNGEEPLSQLQPQNSQLITFNINPSAIQPGDYSLRVEFLSNSGQSFALQSSSVSIQGPIFQITQIPPYQTFYPGQEATFIFRVKNTGNQEGPFDLRLKAYDLIDSTRRRWLSPNEEKALTFGFMLPEDLEERDYFADYELKASAVSGGSKGQIKYHLAGISLNVSASLEKPYYNEGETAHLTINIQSNNPNPQNLFARANYAGYEPQQTFTLNGSQVLIFDVPLPNITGQKLFYGIYHESGRSIHLNSLYIHKAGDVITITTDKQVYNAGETVSVTLTGSATGDMTLSAPGGYTETFTFTGSTTKSFPLPSTIAAGTYSINAQLSTLNSELVTAVHPFDVAGIQVKVLECQNDKSKYASSDTINTSLTISSNQTMPAILKAWIVDPKGQYMSVGENSVNLSSSEALLTTRQSSLSTTVSGIHRLVYGIYASGDLLLASGSEAFDVGDAVLLGITTGKRDYPTNTEPVIVTGSLFGSVDANLDLELDGNVVKSESISLSGFYSYQTQLQTITPGPHTLKATLTAGGLKSTKEVTFNYALAFMPKPQISASPAYLDFGSVNLGSTSTQTFTLSNTGNVDLVIGTIALSGTTQGEFSKQNDNCSGRTIAPSGSCSLEILFSPTSLGSKSASLLIPSNATETPTLNLPLSGTGVMTLNLDVSINPIGGGRVTGEGIDCPGDCMENFSTSGASIQLTATPMEGYQFTSWAGDINTPDNPVTINIDNNKNITANFVISAYTINATAGSGGTISPSGSVKVNSEGNQAFTITPNPGYHVLDVKVDGASVGTVTVYTFNNVTAGHTIEASFAINQYTITATAGPNGTISPSGAVAVNYGVSQTFTITPNPGYHVADVWVDGVSVDAVSSYTFADITVDHTIEATFAQGLYTLDLPRTGQILKYAQGDDGWIRAGIIWAIPRFTSNPDTTLTDNLTGIVWAPDGGTPTIGSCAGGPKTWQGALDYAACLNANNHLGYNDWRVPNVNEMESLIHAGEINNLAWLTSQGFTNAVMAYFWSSTTLISSPDQAWAISLHQGEVIYDPKESNHHVWPVRGMTSPPALLWKTGQTATYSSGDDGDLREGFTWPGPRFTMNPNATLIDKLTGLVWLSDAGTPTIGSCTGGPKTWQGALDYIACLNTNNYLGHNDWRLPNRKEWRSLIHYGQGNMAYWLNSQGFSNMEPGEYWSSTTYASSSEAAWSIEGASGEMDGSIKNAYLKVLPVRAGTLIPNQSPNPAPTGGGVYEINNPILLGGQVSDFDGDLVNYEWLEGDRLLFSGQVETLYGGSPVNLQEQTVYLGLGTHLITLRVSDGVNQPVTSDVTIQVIDTMAPTLAPVPDKTILWPPNHKMVDITIWANAEDNTGGLVELEASVSSNEPQDGLGDGDTSPDWTEPVIDQINGIITLKLRSERSGAGNGRIYTIAITGRDSSGNSSQANVEIKVPHDKGKK